MSGFLNATYDYKSKYLFSFSGRYDGYSKLVDNRWGFFPGVSAAWNRAPVCASYEGAFGYLCIQGKRFVLIGKGRGQLLTVNFAESSSWLPM